MPATGCEGLRRLIDAWMPYPAHIMDPYYNCVMYNDAAGWVLGMRPENTQNCIVDFFTDSLYRSRSHSWEQNARTVVAQFRAASSARPHDEGFPEVPARPDLTVVLRTSLDEANTAAELEWLASPEGRRGAMYPVAG